MNELTEFLRARIAEDEADRWHAAIREVVELAETVFKGDGPIREGSNLEGQTWAYERTLRALVSAWADDYPTKGPNGSDLYAACCAHCGCPPGERIGHDDTCRDGCNDVTPDADQ